MGEGVPRLQLFLRVVLVFALYLGAGKLGLSVPFTSGNVSPVWPASGVALASVLLWGYKVWPGIALGAFLINFLSPLSAWSALGITLGNTSSALFGGYLLRRFSGFQLSLAGMRDVRGLAMLGAVVSPIVAASVGVTTLFLTNVNAWSGFGSAWRIWWLGDAMGILIITPLFLTGRESVSSLKVSRLIELLSLLLGLLAASFAIFSGHLGLEVRDDVLAFVVFPFVIWGAIRFRVAGAAMASFLIAAVAIWGTAQGNGPFVKHSPLQNAELLQLFIAVIAVTGLILAAVVKERQVITEAVETKETLLRAVQQAQSSLQDAHERLEIRVRERTAELEGKTAQVTEQSELLDMANDAILVRTLDDKIAYWNRGAERLYGWTREEVLGRSINDLLQAEFPKPIDEIKALLLHDETWQGEVTHSKRDGSRIVVASRWTLWRNREGEPRGSLQINTDITERKRAEESLRALSGQLLRIQDEERRCIARELHDSAGQMIAALGMSLAVLQSEASKISPSSAKTIRNSLDLVDELSKEVRTISYLLHPPLLDEIGLSSALRLYLEGFTERSKIRVDFEIPHDFGRLSQEAETAIFRVVQESLTNIHRHSGSQVATIRITRSDNHVLVEVEDRGKGIPPEKRLAIAGVGIRGMRERLRHLGGSLEVDTHGTGTVIVARLPIARRSD